MIISIIYVLLALLGISFLIFIHELGHYFAARKEGIKVEVFAIGFGKALYQWEREGVIWKIGFLPFGGYVKMAMEGPDSFSAKTPWQRLKVAFAGPLINLLFALFIFSVVALMGGRNQPFAEHSKYIGWVDRDSEAYGANLRAGDEIDTVNGSTFTGFQNFLRGAAFDKQDLTLQGFAIDYFSGEKSSFTYAFQLPSELKGVERAFPVLKTLNPAYYLLYEGSPVERSADSSTYESTPLEGSGIAKGDRVLWVDGELIFSLPQIIQAVNTPKVLLTVQRGETIFLCKVPRLKVADLRLSDEDKEELIDLRFEASLPQKIQELFFIPYNISSEGTITEAWGYIDEKTRPVSMFEPAPQRALLDRALEKGDKIIAVQGEPVRSAQELFRALQIRKSLIIVEREKERKILSWQKANEEFVASFHGTALSQFANSIGNPSAGFSKEITAPISTKLGEGKELILLRPIIPITMNELVAKIRSSKEKKPALEEESAEELVQKKAIKAFEAGQNWLVLGALFKDETVRYNPSPFVVFGELTKEVCKTLGALFTGGLKMKNLAGPVGIVQIMQHSWSLGIKEALFWMGMISLNLGLLNLLPIPVLDGGTITLSLFEIATKKSLKQKTLEKLIIPFAVLLILYFVYLTYHDLIRIFKSLF